MTESDSTRLDGDWKCGVEWSGVEWSGSLTPTETVLQKRSTNNSRRIAAIPAPPPGPVEHSDGYTFCYFRPPKPPCKLENPAGKSRSQNTPPPKKRLPQGFDPQASQRVVHAG